jgi:hypothetical protein
MIIVIFLITVKSNIRKLPVDILGITFNQGVDILGKQILIGQNLPVDILG